MSSTNRRSDSIASNRSSASLADDAEKGASVSNILKNDPMPMIRWLNMALAVAMAVFAILAVITIVGAFNFG